MSLPDLETAIVARLQAQVQPLGLAVEPFPERPENYHLTHPVGKVLVIFAGSTNGPDLTDSPISYERNIHFSLCTMLRNLRGPSGIYDVLEALRVALDGWTPDGFRRARVIKEAFVGNQDGAWVYETSFEATVLVVRPVTSWS